jgi:type I restriction enzyme, S subunit
MEIIEKTYLKSTSFQLLQNWSVRYLLESRFSYNEKFELVPIGSFLKKSRNKIKIENGKSFQRVTVKINNGGVIPRDTELGENIGTKIQYEIKPGQFLMSKIDARNGAFGLVPASLDSAIVTNDFPVFDVDNTKIVPEFLVLITTTKEFIQFAQSCSSGTTNRQRIDIESFLNVKIPLPPLSEQNRIVEAYIKKLQIAEETENKAIDFEQNVQSYLSNELGIEKGKRKDKSFGLQTISYKEINRWALSYLFKEQRFSMDNVKYPIVPLKTLITFFKGGKTPSTSRKDFWGGDIYWTSAKDMKSLFLNSVQDKITEKAVMGARLEIYPKGTILGVFRSGILRHSFPVAITQMETTINQDLKAIGVNEEVVLKEYFLFYLKTFQKMILERAQKCGVTVESINSDEFLEIPVVLPPIQKQKIIIDSISQMLDNIDNLKSDAILLRSSALKDFENEIFKPCN